MNKALRARSSAQGLFLILLAVVSASHAEDREPPDLRSPSLPAAQTTSEHSWKASLTYKFIFPSMIIANATRKAPASKPDTVLGNYYGAITVRVHTEAPNTPVVLKVAIDEIAEPTESKFVIPTPGDYSLRPKIQWRYDKLRSINQPIPVNITVAATINGVPVGEKKGAVRVLTVNDVPTAIKTATGDTTFAWMFAAYVNEEHPWIDELLREAKNTGRVKGFVGYQRGPQEVDRQVQSVYEMLHQRGMVYSSIVTNSSPDPQVHSQHVRFLSESVKTSQANCIDGVVLMASILRKIGIQSFIITGPGHAILGYRPDLQNPKMIHVVETTMVSSAPFGQALKAGGAKFTEWNSKDPHDPQFHVIDVAKARQDGIMPISR